MVLRESNAVFLEILGPSPAAGVPLEVDVFDGANPGTLLATLDGATNIAFTQPLNDVGGGGFQISRHDPKAIPEYVGRENLFKIKVGGIYRFAFWGEHRELTTLDASKEEGGEVWEISGRGAIAYLDRAAMAGYSLIGDDPQPGGKWPLHLAGTGTTLGAMLNRCVQERLAEPDSAIKFLTQNWNYTYDSQNNLWSDTAEITVTTGDSLLDIWRQFTALGVDSRMRHDLRLEAYVELGRHYDVAGGTGTVVLRAGKHFTSVIRKTHHTNEVKSRLWVKGSGDDWYEISNAALEADPYIGRREGALQFGATSDPTTLQRAGDAELAARAQQVEGGISVEVTNNGPGDYEPFVDYDVGDWITIHEPGVYDLQTVRIVGLSLEQVEQSYTTRLDLNTIEYEALVQLARRMERGGKGTAGASSGLSAPAGTNDGASVHPSLAAHDTLGLATDAQLAAAIAGITVAVDDLTDVDLTGLADDYILVYDNATGLWKVEAKPTGGGGGGGGGGTSEGSPQGTLLREYTFPDVTGWAASGGGSVVHHYGLDSLRHRNLVRSPTSGTASYTAISQYNATYSPDKAANGKYDMEQSGGDYGWAPTAYAAGNWWQVNWTAGQALDTVVLYNRSRNTGDYFGPNGTLTFSDGSSVAYTGLPDTMGQGAYLVITFPRKTGITWMRVTTSGGGLGVGSLVEVEAYDGAGRAGRLRIIAASQETRVLEPVAAAALPAAYEVEVSVIHLDNVDDHLRLHVNMQDANNGYMFTIRRGGVQMYQQIGGGFTDYGAQNGMRILHGFGPKARHRLLLRNENGVFDLFWNGSWVGSWVERSRAPYTGGRVGLGAYGGRAEFEDLKIYSLTP